VSRRTSPSNLLLTDLDVGRADREGACVRDIDGGKRVFDEKMRRSPAGRCEP
jgi:hypothetical protein